MVRAAQVVFTVALLAALASGLLAAYARDVKRDRTTTRLFATVGVVATVAAVATGVWWL